MENRLPNIDQNHIIALYKERFDNPEIYAERPLIIWRSIINDDMDLSHRIISECNKDKKKDDYRFLALRKLYIDHLKENGLGVSHTINPKIHKVCSVYFDLVDIDIETNHSISFETYSSLIKKDWLKRLNEEIGAPIILHLPFMENPGAFEDISQYIYKPDFDEWKEGLAEYQNPLLKHLIGFLESSESEEKRNYRWYWYFQRQMNGNSSSNLKSHLEGTGCDFPSCWMEGIGDLRKHFILPMAQIPKNYIPPKPTKISEIPMEDFKVFFKKGISEDVVEDFRNYLIEHNVEIQGNKRIP